MIVVIPQGVRFRDRRPDAAPGPRSGVDVQGGIVQGDDGVLIANRLPRPLPFVDEVAHIDRVPLNMMAAVEVAPQGQAVRQLAQPVRHRHPLRPDAAGNDAGHPHRQGPDRPALGGRDPHTGRRGAHPAHSRRHPDPDRANGNAVIGSLDQGADDIMKAHGPGRRRCTMSQGEPGTNVGGMIGRIRQTMSDVTEKPVDEHQDPRCAGRRLPGAAAGDGRRGPGILAGERRRAGRHGQHRPPADGAGGPGAERRDPRAGRARRRRGQYGDPGRADHARHRRAAGRPGPGSRLDRCGAVAPGRAGAQHASGRRRPHGDAADQQRAGSGGHSKPPSRSSATRWPRSRACSTFATRTTRSASSRSRWTRGSYGRVALVSGDRADRRSQTEHTRGAHPAGAPGGQAEGLCAQRPARVERHRAARATSA